MSWWTESGVLNKGDMQNVQSGGSPGTELKTIGLNRFQLKFLNYILLIKKPV